MYYQQTVLNAKVKALVIQNGSFNHKVTIFDAAKLVLLNTVYSDDIQARVVTIVEKTDFVLSLFFKLYLK